MTIDSDWFLNLNNPAMYASMIFFAIAVIGIIMSVKIRHSRLNIKNMIEADKLRDTLADEKRLMDKHSGDPKSMKHHDRFPQKEGDGWSTVKPKNFDDLMKGLEKDKDE